MDNQRRNGDPENIAERSREISPIEGIELHDVAKMLTSDQRKNLIKGLAHLMQSKKHDDGATSKFTGVPESHRTAFKANVDEAFAPKEKPEDDFNNDSN